MNMFKPTDASTIEEYLDAIDEPRRSEVVALHKLIIELRPDLPAHFAYNMIGYGSFPYRNYKKELISWPFISLASQKNYMSVYVCALENGEYVAEKHKSKLGNVNVGKSCIRFKKLQDLDLEYFKQFIRSLDVEKTEMAAK